MGTDNDFFEDIEARVARGAAFLDEKVPGWERKIDLDKLDMGSGAQLTQQGNSTACIVCQITGQSYPFGIRDLLSITDTVTLSYMETERRYGFLCDSSGSKVKAEYAALDAAWTALIKERFATGNLSDNDTAQ